MEILQALHDAGFATALRRAGTVYPFVNAAHILSFGLIVGAIGTLDLRVLGLFRNVALGQLAPPLSRVAASGVALTIVTGFLLFSVQPLSYAQNGAFLAKVSLAVLGIANALVLNARPAWKNAVAGGAVGASLKVQAAASLLIWIMAVIAGRWIAFVE
ncbi:MAG: DUF2214 domain-containing protein [Rhodospirillaceae bacterium]